MCPFHASGQRTAHVQVTLTFFKLCKIRCSDSKLSQTEVGGHRSYHLGLNVKVTAIKCLQILNVNLNENLAQIQRLH